MQKRVTAWSLETRLINGSSPADVATVFQKSRDTIVMNKMHVCLKARITQQLLALKAFSQENTKNVITRVEEHFWDFHTRKKKI